MRPSQEMKASEPCFPGRRALFWMGVDRFNVHGHEAYQMRYPHKDNPGCWKAYRAGIRAAEFGRNYRLSLKEALQ